MMKGEELWQVQLNSSLDEFSLFDATHHDDDVMMMLNDFQVHQDHDFSLVSNDNLCFDPPEFSFPDISFDEIEEEQSDWSSLIGLKGNDQNASPYYSINEVQAQNESYNSLDQVVDQNFNQNLYFDLDDLLKDPEQLQNELPLPASVDHFTAENTADTMMGITHTELNHAQTALVPSTEPRECKHWTEKEQRLSLIGLKGNDQNASPYYPITEVQPQNESYNSLDQVVDQNFNKNMYFDPDDLLRDPEQLQNELPLPASVDHFAAENTADTMMGITHTKLNHASTALVPSTEPRECKHWTEKEQSLFLLGLKRYGWGKWKKISDDFVTTRTKTQVASHAQKYLQRVKAPKEKKIRKSIHDMTLRDRDVRAAPNFDQQTRVRTPNFGIPQLQQVQLLQNLFLTPNLATQQLQEVQQLPYNVPYQMNGFGYLGDSVDPHNIQLHNWISCPIQPHAMQAQGLSQSTSQIAMGYRTEDVWMLQGFRPYGKRGFF